MKYSEFSLEGMRDVKVNVHTRWKQLNTLVVDVSERASKQLFITNGAGAIALMSYFGVAEKGRIFLEMKISLCFFVVGLILAMVVTAFLYQGYSFMLEGWRKDTGKFYSGEIEHEQLYENDEKRFKESNEIAATIISYMSFGCFIAGSITTLAVMICGKSIV
jgi:hypothetical protein